MNDHEYAVELQIKRNGSPRAKDAKDQQNTPLKDWTSFKFVLRGQEFIPYLIDSFDNQDPQGCLKVAGCKAAKIISDADDKKFTFKLASETTAYVFNAHDSQTQETTIALLNFAAADKDWYNPFMPNYSEAAAARIRQLYYCFRAKKRAAALRALYPHLYLVSVNRVVQESEHKVFAYVSGLVTLSGSSQPVCVAATPEIKEDNAFHVGVVAYHTALSHLSVSVVDAKDKGKAQHASLGTVFVPLSKVPSRCSSAQYTTFNAVLPLEPHALPPFRLAVGNSVSSAGPTAPPTSPLTMTGHSKAGKDDDAQSVATTVQADPQHHHYRDTATVDDDTIHSSANHGATHTANNTDGSLSANDNIALLRATSSGSVLQGRVSLSVYSPSPHHAMCGWLLKKSDTWILGGSYRPYYFVLMNGELQYFQQAKKSSVLTLDQPKKLLFCANITAVEVKNDTICVSFKQNNTRGVWKLRVMESGSNNDRTNAPSSPTSTATTSPTNAATTNASTTATNTTPPTSTLSLSTPSSGALQRMWVRKLVRCVPGLEDPDLRAAADVGLFPESDVKLRSCNNPSQSTTSTSSAPADVTMTGTAGTAGTENQNLVLSDPCESLVGTFKKERRASIRL